MSGADAPSLANLVEKHVTTAAYSPLSRTDQAPAEAPSTAPSLPDQETAEEAPEELEKRLHQLMNQSKVVLFMKGSPNDPKCGFSRKIVGLLQDEKVNFTHFDILTDESVRQGIYSHLPRFPSPTHARIQA